MNRRSLVIATCAFLLASVSAVAADGSGSAPPPSYSQIHAIFQKHCLGCHNAKDADGELLMESHALLMKGGENGPIILPSKPDESPLMIAIEYKKKPFMPPPKKRDRLGDADVALVRAWIAGGAQGPKAGETIAVAPVIPDIKPKGTARKPVQAIAYSPKTKTLAIARAHEVEIRSADGQTLVRTLSGHNGNVNELAFTADGKLLAAAAGDAGQSGEVRLWNVADGALVRTFAGHADAVYSIAISRDGKLLASGSYDQKIILWDLASGQLLRELTGHNGAVFGLAFRPDGKVLASASADRTLKLWNVATGKRLDTRPEATKELQAVAFSPDGKQVYAAGADNRIRVWQVSADAIEGTNPIVASHFAHEGAILRLAFSADGKSIVTSADDATVKLRSAADLKQQAALPKQPDWPTAIAFGADDKTVVVGRLDGSVAFYDAKGGKEIVPPKPDVSRLDPMGLRRGEMTRVKVIGTGLGQLTGVKVIGPSKTKLAAKLVQLDDPHADYAWVEFTPANELPAGEYKIAVTSAAGDSKPVSLYVDSLRQEYEQEPNDTPAAAAKVALPMSLWGKLDKAGDADCYVFEATAGQTIVFDAEAQRLGSKADLVLTLLNSGSKVLETAGGLDDDPDPLLAYTFEHAGTYVIRVTELLGTGGASAPKPKGKGKAAAKMKETADAPFYRLSAGSFAYVTGCYPLAVAANAESRVALVGYNLPVDAHVKVKAGDTADAEVALDSEQYRSRRAIRVMVSSIPEALESEPNDKPGQANAISVPGAANGRIDKPLDADLFRFDAKKGETYIVETFAGRRGTPVDTRIEILWPDGKPVERVLLRAVRDSYINFRAIDGNGDGARLEHYLEMQLNQYLYMNGEVVKLFLEPRGPDSDYNFYKALGGKRRCYFDTSPTSHALEEKTYIVEPHAPGETLPPNGLPVFPLNYSNDDDSDRLLGSDSKLTFTPPQNGAYLVRVTDTRGFGGDRFAYRLVVRPARPDFSATVELTPPNVEPGAGRSFDVKVNRIDGFDGPIRVDLSGAPAGWRLSTPITVEARHLEAKGTLYAPPSATMPGKPIVLKGSAQATIDAKAAIRAIPDVGPIALSSKTSLSIWLEPAAAGGATQTPGATTRPAAENAGPAEITVRPGQLVPAMLHVGRNGFKGEIKFDAEDLPHGVIVSDIGLSGILITPEQSQRQIFLHCADWVPDTDRLCHFTSREGAKPTSPPVLIHVRRPVQAAQTP